jgi:excisionase family DNA binding protein
MSEALATALLDLLRPEIQHLVHDLAARELEGLPLPQHDPWLTTLEAASYLRLSPEALRARVRRGTIPAHRDGHRLLFHRDELDQHLAGTPTGTAATLPPTT